MLSQASGSLQGKLTVVVGSAPSQPHGLVKTAVVEHPGTKHVLQAVPVAVTVGQLAAEVHAFVEM